MIVDLSEYEDIEASGGRERPFGPLMDNGSRKRPGIRFLSYAEMINLPKPEWLVDGLIQRHSSALLFGASNAFKTFLAIDIGLSVNVGNSWHGKEVKRGGVVFVATEGANGVGNLRVPAWYDAHQVSEGDRTAWLYPKEIRLDVPDDITDLIEEMNRRGSFELVVLDIFGGTMAGSEIEDKTARAWVHGTQRILRETKAAILTVAHTGWQNEARARMHTHFWGSFDSRMKAEGDKDARTTVLKIERHKDADSLGTWGFRLVEAGSSLVPLLDSDVRVAAPAGKSKRLTPTLETALAALDDAVVADGTLRQGPDWPNCKIVSKDSWRRHCDRRALTVSDLPDSKKRAFQRAAKELVALGRVSSLDDYFWLCFGRDKAGQSGTSPGMSRDV